MMTGETGELLSAFKRRRRSSKPRPRQKQSQCQTERAAVAAIRLRIRIQILTRAPTILRVCCWQHRLFADFFVGPPDFFRGFVAGFFLGGKSAQKNPPGKSPAKASKIYTTKFPNAFLQRGRANTSLASFSHQISNKKLRIKRCE